MTEFEAERIARGHLRLYEELVQHLKSLRVLGGS